MPGTALGAILDEEFLFLLSLLRPLYAFLGEEHRDQARLWLQRLCWVPALGDSARKDRNEYLSRVRVGDTVNLDTGLLRLYHGMLTNKLNAVFLDEPPEGALRPAAEVFPPVDFKAWLKDVAAEVPGEEAVGGTGGGGDVDERTYLATQVLPEGRGAFGYLAVSLAKGGPHWIRSDQEDSSVIDGQPQATSTPLPTAGGESESLEDLLDNRPPPEQRGKLLQLYDSLIQDIDQAEREPEKSSPSIERLIASLQESTESPLRTSPVSGVPVGDVPQRQRELLVQLRERLRSRKERAAQRSSLLDSLADMDLSSATSALDSGPTPERVDQDDVRSMRPENVALLEAAYPRALVRRFLDGIVRERVGVLARVRARRFFHDHVEGVEEEAAHDMSRYRDATTAWAALLRSSSDKGADSLQDKECAGHADRCADLAAKVADLIVEIGAARQQLVERQGQLQTIQNDLRAEVEVLRGEASAAKRRLDHMMGNTL